MIRQALAIVMLAFFSVTLVAACSGILGTSFDGLSLADAGPDDAGAACAADASAFYVRVGASPDAGGCVFPTVTAAAAAARASHAPLRTIHVANGTYNAAGGETFPIDLRGGISIEGEGNSTLLEGVGLIDLYPERSAVKTTRITLLTGDEQTPAHVSHLSMVSGMQTDAGAGVVGILCNRGNAVAGRDQPPPNLTIEYVTIGLQYSIGMAITNRLEPVKSGCNARIVSSTIEGINNSQSGLGGIDLVGCGQPGDGTYVAAQVGDEDPSTGNVIHQMNDHFVDVSGCVSSLSLVSNKFDTGARGVSLDWAGEQTGSGWISIRKNSFSSIANGALNLAWGAHVDELIDNTFTSNDVAAIHLWDHGTTAWPELRRARGNRIIGNHVGICFDGVTPFTGIVDFGTANDPGNNVFSCNSYAGYRTPCRGSALTGGDVLQFVPRGATGTATFAGNVWDHAPPTVRSDVGPPNDGVDYYAVDGNGPSIEGATIASTPCTGKFVRGP